MSNCPKSWGSSSNFSSMYAYLSNVEPSNSVFLKIYNTEFDEIIITSTDQNDRLLEIEGKVNMTWVINK